MLALDFDGVVADALQECAAVTWHAGPFGRGATAPRLPDAIDEVPQSFIETFRQVRAYSRTLDDFMVANVLHERPGSIDRQLFQSTRELHRRDLADQAAVAERVRGKWRDQQYDQWTGLHTVHPEVAELIANARQDIVIVSAKDAESIKAVLKLHGLDEKVSRIEGACKNKRHVLQALLNHDPDMAGGGIIFVDDSIENILDARDLPVRVEWAGWGYHGPEDLAVAAEHDVRMLHLSEVAKLTAAGGS